MAVKPFQSTLIPYQDEIADLRSQRPPVSYARIAVILYEKYGLHIRRGAIAKFVKVRSRGRKVYSFKRDAAVATSKPVRPGARPGDPGSRPPLKPKFEFKYSERYNLTRLPDEVADARRKKLEEEGH